MAKGLVSIITPSYNCARFLKETIDSVQAQTYQDWEMIIVDDCSTDNTADLVASYMSQDKRIRYFCNEKNSGAAVSRNKALREAKGKWMAFLDGDDTWAPNKLEHQIDFMLQNGFAFSYHEYEEMDEDSHLLGIHVSGKTCVSKWEMYSCCWPGCLSVMYDRDTIGLIEIADIKKNNDTAMWLKVAEKAKCYLLPESLAYYRRRQGSITPPTTVQKILWHYPLFHDAAGMNPLLAWFWTCINIGGNMYKKIFYVKKN